MLKIFLYLTIIFTSLKSEAQQIPIEFRWDGCTPACNMWIRDRVSVRNYLDIKSPYVVKIESGMYSTYLCNQPPEDSEEEPQCVYILRRCTDQYKLPPCTE